MTAAPVAAAHQTSPSREDIELTARDRVLVLGGYGVRNVGDEAILAGLLRQLPQVAAVRVVSRNPAETAALHGVSAVSPLGALPALLRSDLLIVGGGGIFSADTGPFGRFIPLVSRIALTLHRRVAFHGVGVYASTPARIIRSLVRLAPRLESFSVRDSASQEVLVAAGLSVARIADLSESLQPVSEAESWSLLSSAGLDPARPIVALCLTSLNEPLSTFLRSATPKLVAALPNVQFCFVPISQHQTNPRHNDLNLAAALKREVPQLKVVVGVHHPALVLGLFRHFSAAVCVRFHSYLFASRTGVPIVPLPYAEKCESWLAEHRLSGVPWTDEALIKAVKAALSAGAAAEPRRVG